MALAGPPQLAGPAALGQSCSTEHPFTATARRAHPQHQQQGYF